MGALNSIEQTTTAVERARDLAGVGSSPLPVRSEQAEENEAPAATLADILILLANIHDSDIKIPLFLVVDILNYAEVLPPIVAERFDNFCSGNNCDITYLNVTLPRSRYVVPSLLHVEALSRDQGWSSYPGEQGTRTSHTWAEILISSHPSERFPFFRNIHAGKEMECHSQVIPLLGDAPESYRALRDAIVAAMAPMDQERPDTDSGDQKVWLGIQARSQYPGWNIILAGARIELRYQLAGDWDAFAAQWAGHIGR